MMIPSEMPSVTMGENGHGNGKNDRDDDNDDDHGKDQTMISMEINLGCQEMFIISEGG